MKKTALLFVFLFSLSNGVYSQIILERTIDWAAPVEISLPHEEPELAQKKSLLHFKNAVFSDPDIQMPEFFELIEVTSEYSEFRVELQNEVFTDFTAHEIRAISNGILLKYDIEIDARLFYQRKRPYVSLQFAPARINHSTGRPEKLVSFEIVITPLGQSSAKTLRQKSGFAASSVLSTGKWIKIRTESDGVYQLTFTELLAMGFDNPANIRLFGNGNEMLPLFNNEPRTDDLVEKPIFMEKGADGIFNQGDFIIFYAQGPVSWSYNPVTALFEHNKHLYSKFNFYFLTARPGSPKLIPDLPQPAGAVTHTVNSFDDFAFHEEDLHNLILSGRRWFGELFDVETSRRFNFPFPNILSGSQVKIRAAFASRSPLASSIHISHNQQNVLSLSLPPVFMESLISDYASVSAGTGFFAAVNNIITLTVNYSKPSPSARGWLDYILLNARRNLVMTGHQMHFRDIQSVGTGNLAEFIIGNAVQGLKVWNITDPGNIINITGTLAGNTYTFRHETGSLSQFIAFAPSNFLKPHIVGNVPNQNLHGLPQTDFIIVSHPMFLAQARQLANYRNAQDGLSTVVVTPEQIFNEFSSGKPDIASIRNFMKMFYDRAVSENDMPKYLLLFGDGSYDNMTDSPTNSNFILTYQSENSLRPTHSFVTDDFFGLLDDSEGESTGLLDIGIGRLPVSSVTQAQTMIDKILRYENKENKGDWQNYVTFIGDDGDNNIHMQQADFLAEYVSENYSFFNIDKIYLDAYQRVSGSGGQRYPEANRAILNRINKGTLLINYTGHGNELRLSHENILDVGDIMRLRNKNVLPVFMTATCEFSRFDNPQRTSGGEMLLLNPNGGGIAHFSTTRLVFATPNFFLNQKFYQFIFSEKNGEPYRLGDVIRLTKNASGTGINKLNFTLLGDPSLLIAVPRHEIKITSINGEPVTLPADTLKSMGKYTITGEVELNGTKDSYFNGFVYSTVFDKSQPITTLSNDGNTPFQFEIRNNIIYRGKSSVKDGLFSFTFYVPKDIRYHIDKGKISTFATGNIGEAKGAFFDILIGGTSGEIAYDKAGPVIEMFMNDRNFVFGGTTNENPILLAFLTDSTGINTTGIGIGHDITAIINGNTNDPLVLNDFYIAETDNFKKGSVEYPLTSMEEGNNSIRLKAWDVYNNSSEEYIEFVVARSAKLALRNVLNYPNPFTGFTFFHFEHNQPGSQLDILIQIFTISGRLVKTIQADSFSPGFKPEPIPWDGLDDFGDRIGRGVYLYRVKIRTETGQVAEKYEKLVILK